MSRIEAKAYNLLQKYNIKNVPVPVDELAKQEGVLLSYEPFEGNDNISGMLFRDNSRVIIGINNHHAETRQRFTIAHELGHLLLHQGDLYIDKGTRINFRNTKSSLAIDKQEIEANAFAAALLMPSKLIEDEFHKVLDRDEGITADELIITLAGKFQVSRQAMQFRLINFGYIIQQI